MKTIIYHNPRCSKSREALQLLIDRNENIDIVEYLKNPPSESELQSIVKKLKINPLQLVRVSETLFKEKYKDKVYSDEQWIKIMAENPVLIERPIVIKENKAVIGRPPVLVVDIL